MRRPAVCRGRCQDGDLVGDIARLVTRVGDHAKVLNQDGIDVAAMETRTCRTAPGDHRSREGRTDPQGLPVTLTVADIDRWSAESVREVFHAAGARGNATLEASRQLSTLAVFDTWEGATAEARKHSNASIRQDLDAHGNESFAVAQAAGKAADDIEHVQSELRTLRARCHRAAHDDRPVEQQGGAGFIVQRSADGGPHRGNAVAAAARQDFGRSQRGRYRVGSSDQHG